MKILLLAGAGIALLIGAVLLLRQRRPVGTQIPPGLAQATGAAAQGVQGSLPPFPAQAGATHGSGQPMGPRQRRQFLQYLKSAYDKGSKTRLAAMEDMVAWGHPACLPLLRRGLRDPDLRVVGLAARGLERFRGPRLRGPLRRLRPRVARRPAQPV